MLNNKKLNKGILITFEGIDGSGKSTQIKKLKNYFKKKKIKKFHFTKEPGGSEFGNLARKLLLNNNKIKISIESQILLLVASRYEHYEKLILPLIKKREIVISDRFQDSTFAYQCGNDKKLANMLKYLNQILLKNLEPNLTILLDIKPKLAIKRMQERKLNNFFDKKSLGFYSKTRNNYLKLAKYNKRIKVLDATLNKEELFNKIIKLIFYEIEKNAPRF